MGKQTLQSPLISFIKKGSMTLLLSTSALLLFSRYFSSDLIFTFESNQQNIDMVKGCALLRKVPAADDAGSLSTHFLPAHSVFAVPVLQAYGTRTVHKARPAKGLG